MNTMHITNEELSQLALEESQSPSERIDAVRKFNDEARRTQDKVQLILFETPTKENRLLRLSLRREAIDSGHVSHVHFLDPEARHLSHQPTEQLMELFDSLGELPTPSVGAEPPAPRGAQWKRERNTYRGRK